MNPWCDVTVVATLVDEMLSIVEYTVCASLVLLALGYWRVYRKRRLDPAGRAVFISGCDSGIGRRLAILFSDLGCHVFAGCLRPDAAKTTLPPTVRVLPLDITDESSVKVAVDTVKGELLSLSKDLWAVINNAGVCIYGEFDWLTMPHCSSQIEVNLLGTIRVTKAFLPLIRQSKGRVVTITSVNGSVAYPGLAVYCATKFGLEGFCNALRQEVAKYGVSVVVVQPGDFARLTSIMADHQLRAQEMWQGMTEEDKKFYDSYFHHYHKTVLSNYGITSPKNFESSPLLGDVKDAVLSQCPAARYQSAPLSFRLFFRFLFILPVSLSDALLGLLFNQVFKAK